ncbi:hypothetical protein MTR67_032091 [Solanum verrucosum]|uniref:Reverse transcriptase zinc-binding domain-containing protein n=1 Tax=Solanum verrucosum TaxID=315347 RepID=A0AAF0U3Q0_SOLVR|nr:hypothetical protein MTR67_032091 [Solanum verrucosum]
MLDCGELNLNKSYFKFEQWWLRVDGFADKIKEWWLSFNINGTGSYILAVKLKMLKQKLKEWRMTHRNDWKRKKEEILQQLAEMEKTQELRLLSEDELLQKVHLAMEFEEVAKQEEIAWRQRSRIQWLKKGDKNTKFFHRVATAHKRFNSIDTLVVEGNSISDPEDIKGEIINFYQKLYTETEQWRPEFKLQGLETITEEERDWLQTHFEEAEVLKCIKSCASDKAPGPDGFPMCFFQSFWEDVIVSKYGQTDSWTSNTVTSTYGVSVWRSIRNLWPKLTRNICYKVGEGTRILFWKDKWIGQNSLMEDFADLYSFCDNPGASIAEMWSQQGWNITLRRLLNDWEVDRVANLLQRLEDFPGLNINPDAIRWKHDRDGEFSVGTMYKRDLATQPGEIAGPWKQIWKSNTPTKIKCFTWLVCRRACLTQERLKKRGFQIVSRCFFCHEKEETNNHLFLHCRVTAQIWYLFQSIIQDPWVVPEHTADLLNCWMRRGGSKTQKKWWNLVPSCIWWSIWKERNNRCFKNITNPMQKVKENCINTLYFWCKEEGIDDIVPTEYRYLSKEVLPTNQFSVSEYFSPINEFDRTWPAVYFLYDLSPITVTIREERRNFLHFITRLCAVLGGTFALTGMLDKWMFRFLEAVMKKNSRSLVR